MKTQTLEFRNEDTGDNLTMVIGAADVDLNEFFRAASMVFIRPHTLALQLGRLSVEREREILMGAYACGVVLSTDPKMKESEILTWFQTHPGEFDILFEIADHRKNFEDDEDTDQHGATGAPPEQGDEGAG